MAARERRQASKRPGTVPPAVTTSQKKGRHPDPTGAWIQPASIVVPRGRTSQQINEDSVQDGEALPGQLLLSQQESSGGYGAAVMDDPHNLAEGIEPGSAHASPRVTRSRTTSFAAGAPQGAHTSSGQRLGIAQLPATGDSLNAHLPAQGPGGDYEVCALLHTINQSINSQMGAMVAQLRDLTREIQKTTGKQVAMFRKTLKAMMEAESMHPDDAMLERAAAHVLGRKDDVDAAREASRAFAALTGKGNKIASNVRQDFAKAAKEAIMSSFYWTEQEGKAKSWGAAPLLPPTERSRDLFLDSARAKRFLQEDRYRTTAPQDKTQAFNFAPFRMAVAAAIRTRDDPMRMMDTTPSRVAFVEQLVRRHLQGENIPNQSDLGKVWVQEYKVLLRQTEQRMKDSAHIFSSEAQSETEDL